MAYVIKETDNWRPLSELFNEMQLEVEIGDTPPRSMRKMWRLEDEETGELMGGATLQFKKEVFALGSLAVRKEANGGGWGEQLLDKVYEETKAEGGDSVWACARIPEYYYKLGWEEMDPDTAPKIFNCQYCDRFRVVCHPAIVRKML